MDTIVLRQAVLSDLSTLLSFEQGVILAERPFDVTIKDGHTNYYDIQGMITAPHINLLVAELEGQLIGCGYGRIETAKPFLKYRQFAYLGFMYVEPQHRGKGINKMIIDALAKWALANGLTELRLEVYDGNLPAIKAYEKVGFSRLLVEMRLDLEENG